MIRNSEYNTSGFATLYYAGIWRLEASLSCEGCRAGHRWKAKVHMIKLSRTPDTSTPSYSPDEYDRP